jgi:hypothetical protein
MNYYFPQPHHPDQDQDQEQDQAQAQAELQAQLQGQGQGQGQGQHQGQSQYAAQAVETSTWNSSANENGNLNGNLNANGNLNGNLNANENLNHNEVVNDIANTVETAVTVTVDVGVGVDAGACCPSDDDVIDIESIQGITQSIVMPDAVSQTVTNGNAFNIDQVSNLTDNDTLSNPTVTFNGGGVDPDDWCCDAAEAAGDFTMTATASGGTASSGIGDLSNDYGTQSGVGAAAANATLTQEAFTQHIAMGANIQFNSLDIHVAGDITDSLTG